MVAERDLAATDLLGPEDLKSLFEISQSLHRYMSTKELLPHISDTTRQLLNTDTVAILLHDSSTDELFFLHTEGNPAETVSLLKEMRFSSHLGISGSVFQNGKPELIFDVAKDPRHYSVVDDKTGFTARSMIVVPLQTRGKSIGVLQTCNKRNGEFDARDLHLMVFIAGTIALALDNARLYDELQSSYSELQLIDRAKDSLIVTAREENTRLRREIEGRFRFDNIKGKSPQLINLFRLCDRAVETDVTVLIEGETGTGKELIARCLHYNGPRKSKRFVVQNCGGIPEALLASELFGYKRGAFTGAATDKRGLFEEAHSGTIFLDEVAEMSPAMQVSLLRVLQEGEVKPLGSNEVRKVDVRVISATHHNLEEDVRSGAFREDLYYRLSVFAIRAPALREREGDLPILADYFVKKANRKLKKSVRGLSRKAMACLSTYSFPGNVRELENEIERAVLMAENDSYIEAFHLSDRIIKGAMAAQCMPRSEGNLKEMVSEMEKGVLMQLLEEHGGNKTRVARQLGLSRFGLAKKMKRYGL
jgi:Nif-specific regulatory protein